jgi:hypothetical protein
MSNARTSRGGELRGAVLANMGDKYPRRLLVNGMTSPVARNVRCTDVADPRI